jgi:hypothetical protein
VRRLKVREVRARKLEQLALICSRVLLENDKGVRRFAPAFMRDSVTRKYPTADPKSRLLSRDGSNGTHLIANKAGRADLRLKISNE